MMAVKISFVCLGNICRSPLAHTIMEDMLRGQGLADRFLVDSSGLGEWHIGKPSDSRMRKTASSHGYTITHRAQQFHWQDGDRFDYIFAMDQSVFDGILERIANNHRNKVMMFRKFDLEGPDGDVPDPYYGGEEGFEQVFKMVENNCRMIIKNLLTNK